MQTHPTTLPHIEPEFLRPDQAAIFSGLSRSAIYNAIRNGDLASISVKDPGNRRGVRLISKQAIRDYLAKFTEPATR